MTTADTRQKTVWWVEYGRTDDGRLGWSACHMDVVLTDKQARYVPASHEGRSYGFGGLTRWPLHDGAVRGTHDTEAEAWAAAVASQRARIERIRRDLALAENDLYELIKTQRVVPSAC